MRAAQRPEPGDLALRLPVWEALSEFWLDTELQDRELAHIARVLAASPYSVEELEAIHRHEVAPAVAANLIGLVGEWAGFDSAWLAQRCEAHARRRHLISHRLRQCWLAPAVWFYTSRHWRQVVPKVLALRSAAT